MLKTPYRKYKAVFTFLSASVLGGFCVLLYEINETITYINYILHPNVFHRKRNVEYIYINKPLGGDDINDVWCPSLEAWSDDDTPSLLKWWTRRKRLIPWRLLEISESTDPKERTRAVKALGSYKKLHDYEYRHLAQACSANTAVSLARVKDVDLRFFLKPRYRKCTETKQELVNSLRKLLLHLNKKSSHACLKYFLNRAFPRFQTWIFFNDFDLSNQSEIPLNVSDDTILPMCIESLVHHCTLNGNAKALIDAGALPLLFDCHKHLCFNKEIRMEMVNLMLELSTNPQFLEDLYQTGWVTVLAEWLQDRNHRLSISAATCLANLDRDAKLKAKYGREVVLLHPAHKETEPIKTDVVLIHGLLGGVHYTWRQRGQRRGPVTILGITSPGESIENVCVRANTVIDEAPQNLDDFNPQADQAAEADYVFVMSDIPVAESFNCKHPCSLDGADKCRLAYEQSCEFTSCWPKDWLPQDCKNLRVVGVNYETRLTDWSSFCPTKDKGARRNLAERCRLLLQQLVDCGIGERPVVWIAHSMGGLLVKHMLIQASNNTSESMEKFCKNTKGIVFLSTPHIGSPWASLNEASRMIFLPSTEVEELRFKSPILQKLHEEFLKFVEENPMQIVSFVETKSIKLTTFEWEFHCVPPNLGDPGTGVIYEIPLAHMDICKPSSKFSFIYQRILSLVRSVARQQGITS